MVKILFLENTPAVCFTGYNKKNLLNMWQLLRVGLVFRLIFHNCDLFIGIIWNTLNNLKIYLCFTLNPFQIF